MLVIYFYDKLVQIVENKEILKYLVFFYVNNYLFMYMGQFSCLNKLDENILGGVMCGVEWYSYLGSMKDYSVIYGYCLEIIVYISCCYFFSVV